MITLDLTNGIKADGEEILSLPVALSMDICSIRCSPHCQIALNHNIRNRVSVYCFDHNIDISDITIHLNKVRDFVEVLAVASNGDHLFRIVWHIYKGVTPVVQKMFNFNLKK